MYDFEELQKYKLFIFDMDGTLFDTSESNYWSYHDAAQQLGYEIEYDKFMDVFVGKNYKEFLPMLGVVKEEDLKKIHDYKTAHYRDYIDKIKWNDELFMLIFKMKNERKIALATTASKSNTMDILEYFGIWDIFDCILTQDDVSRLKPDPECYYKIMKRMHVSPINTVIFEDSIVGIEAANASGAICVKVDDF